jgi:hypothetical protein
MFLRELYEAPQRKVAVAAFGRMNPPTIGHEKLANMIKSFDGDHYIFLSQTQKPKDNPLPFDVKLEFAKKFFPGINVGHPSVRTPIQMLQMLEKLGYTDIIYVAGSDRVASFDKLFNDYNGKEYNFNSIDVVSAGERDPDADGAEGMSASKMRAAAAAGDFEAFAQGVPKPALAQKMYDAVRTGMGVKDKETTEDVSPEDEKKFHNELDNLVHKYFGDSPDEEKMKKKMRKVKEADDEEEKLKGFNSATVKALMNLRARYPQADTELDALLAAVGDNKKLIGTTDIENDLEAADLADRLDKLEKAVKALQKGKREAIEEILGFATKNQKKTTIKKKRPPEEDSVKDKLAKRRAMAAKGDPKAYKSGGLNEGSPVSDLKKIIASKVYKKEYLMALKMMKQEAISAADAARRFMHVDARTLDKMAEKLGV